MTIKEKKEARTYKFEEPPHIMIAEARYFDEVADLQLKAVKDVLGRVGATYTLVTVPGALEIPASILYAVRSLNFDAVRRRFDGYIALGCVIKSGTQHDEIVARESASGLQRLALDYVLAVGNGILTVNTMEQAMEYADPERLNFAGEAAEACLRMIELKQQFHLSSKRRWVAR